MCKTILLLSHIIMVLISYIICMLYHSLSRYALLIMHDFLCIIYAIHSISAPALHSPSYHSTFDSHFTLLSIIYWEDTWIWCAIELYHFKVVTFGFQDEYIIFIYDIIHHSSWFLTGNDIYHDIWLLYILLFIIITHACTPFIFIYVIYFLLYSYSSGCL